MIEESIFLVMRQTEVTERVLKSSNTVLLPTFKQ